MTRLSFSAMIICMMLHTSCISVNNEFEGIPPGHWRAYFKLYDKALENASLGKADMNYKELPFNFEVKYDEGGKTYIELINGEERIELKDISIGIDRSTAKDTVTIDFPVFQSYIKAIYEDGIMEGNWYVKYKDGYSIPFVAKHGDTHRFRENYKEPVSNLTGRWKTSFDFDKDEPYMAVAELVQNGSKLTGTFLTETGDYRFLEGIVQDKKMFLSVFDGAHAFLFEALISDENNLVGIFKSGKHYNSNWQATRDENYSLKDPYELSKATQPKEKVNFTFSDTKGQMVSINDDQFKDKIKIVSVVGTWCPNCRDEAKYLKTFGESHKDIELISICFERYKDQQKSFDAIDTYKEKLGLDWTFLYGGIANKKENQKVLPFIDKLLSYPTILVLDKNNMLRHIHTGFSGPATSKFEAFKSNFENQIKTLSNE